MERANCSGVWVVAEQRRGVLARVSQELAGKGREMADKLGCRLAALLLGHSVQALAQPLLDCGADTVYLLDDPLLADYQSDAYVPSIQALVEAHRPEILLVGATLQGLDLAPRLAARLGTGLAAHCIGLDIDADGRLVQTVPASGQLAVATIVCPDHRPQMATVKPGTFPLSDGRGRGGRVVPVPVTLTATDLRLTIVEDGETACAEGCDLDAASVVVAGGAGISSEEGWHLVESLAAALGGVVGASRPATDAGWAATDRMIGHSGRSVHPKLYVGVGISGDMLHMVGMKDAQVAVAINSNPRAPIFGQVDLGVVGDYRAVIPALLAALVSHH